MALGNNPTPNELVKETKRLDSDKQDNIVQLTAEQYETLVDDGEVTVDGVTYIYDADTFYAIIGSSGGTGVSDVKINNTSIVSSGVANIVTETAYNASSNKIATMSDVPTQASDINAQETLVSGTNIKTINNESILGSGNITVTVDISTKMDKSNPTGTGSFSLNRLDGSTVGTDSVAVGYNPTASGAYSFAQGYGTTASGFYSHSEGIMSTASENSSHSEGSSTTASGNSSHSEGNSTTASGSASHSEGTGTTAQRKSQHAFGEYNVLDTTGTTTSRGDYVEIVGNGTSTSARSNARTLDWSGNEYLAGKIIPAGGISDGNNANYELKVPDTTNWTADKTIATTDQIPSTYVSSVNGNSGAITNVTKYDATSSTTAEQTFLTNYYTKTECETIFATVNLGNVEATRAMTTATINGKAGTKYTGKHLCIESWRSNDGTEWYRKYDDGWKECGTITSASIGGWNFYTINLPITFNSTSTMYPYATFFGSTYENAANTDAQGVHSIVSTNQIKISASNNARHRIYVCGY